MSDAITIATYAALLQEFVRQLGPFVFVGLLAIFILYSTIFAAGGIATVLGFVSRTRRGDFPKWAASVEGTHPRVAIVFVLCDDLDSDALLSVSRLQSKERLAVLIHDESSPDMWPAVDEVVKTLKTMPFSHVMLIRNNGHRTGKGASLNRIKQHLDSYAFFLLLDSDSIISEPSTVSMALRHMNRPDVAAVQCRSVGIGRPNGTRPEKWLTDAVDAYHLVHQATFQLGWMPFIGHNALLRTSAIKHAGYFRENILAEDIELTLRLNALGYKVAYAGEVRIGERAPPSYQAFRRRTLKTTLGSSSLLLHNAPEILKEGHLGWRQKVICFQYLSFLKSQAIYVIFLAALCIATAFGKYPDPWPYAFLMSLGLLGVGFCAPIILYHAKEGTLLSAYPSIVVSFYLYCLPDASSWMTLPFNGQKRPVLAPTNELGVGFDWAILLDAGFATLLLLWVRDTSLGCQTAAVILAVRLYLPCLLSIVYRDKRSGASAFLMRSGSSVTITPSESHPGVDPR